MNMQTEYYGQIPITCVGTTGWSNGETVVRVGIGSNWHHGQGSGYVDACAKLRKHLRYLFAYGDAVNAGKSYAEAETLAVSARGKEV